MPVTSFNTRTGEVVLLEDDVLAALGYAPLNKHGDTMTGPLTLAGAPTSALQASTRAYVDARAGGAVGGVYRITDFNASGSAQKFTGGIASGSTTLTLTVASDFAVGQGIYVTGAGASAAMLLTKVDAIDATKKIVTLHAAASTTRTSTNVQHDDTVAIQTAIDSLAPQNGGNGGTLLFHQGLYRVNGPKGSFNSILKLPFNPLSTGEDYSGVYPQPTYHLMSYDCPVLSVGWPAPTGGAIIQSDVQDPTCSILAAGVYNTNVSDFSVLNASNVYLEGLTFRAYDNPNINGIDFGTLTSCIIRNVLIDTGMPGKGSGSTNPAWGSEPVHGTYGLRMPRVNLASGMNVTENVSVNLFGIGVIGSELWHSKWTYMQRCKVGLQGHELAANYGISGSFLIVQCPTVMYFPAACMLDIHLEIEVDLVGSWWGASAGRYIYDPTDAVTGWVKFLTMAASLGTHYDISVTGCSRLSIVSLAGGFGSKIVDLQPKGAATNLSINDLDIHGLSRWMTAWHSSP